MYPFQEWSSSKPPLNARDALDSAYAFAISGDDAAALAAAEKVQTVASNNEDLSAVHSQKARYLLRLRRSSFPFSFRTRVWQIFANDDNLLPASVLFFGYIIRIAELRLDVCV